MSLDVALSRRRLAPRGPDTIGGTMIVRVRRSRDPFWDDGTGARRTHRRVQFEGLLALGMAIVACGVTAAVWLQLLAPLADTLALR